MVVVDAVESVRLMEEDEAGFITHWRQFVQDVTHQVLPSHQGRLVKSLGDGLLLEFERVQPAIAAALEMQHLIERGRPAGGGGHGGDAIRLRVGCHVADVAIDQLDVYGHGVNLASRLATLADAGETVVSAEVRGQLADGLDADIEDLGDCYLKHIREPVRAYRLRHAQAHAPRPARAAMGKIRPGIAVIPFNGGPYVAPQPYLGEALADEIISSLSRHPELLVISRLSTTALRGRADAWERVRTHLHADYVLTGTLGVNGDEVRLRVALSEAGSGESIWTRSLDGNVRSMIRGDDPALDELIGDICLAISTRQVQRSRAKPMSMLESYCLLMAATFLLHAMSPVDFDRARQLLEHLIERDARHPAPHAWLAKWHVMRVQQGWSDDIRRDTVRARDCCRRALACDPRSSLALAINGFVCSNLMKDLDAAEASHREALAANPNEPLAWLLLGTANAFRGRGAEAVEETARALQLSPLDPSRYFFESLAATAALSAGDYERALSLGRSSLRLNRMHTSTLRAMAIAQVQLGAMEDARRSVSHLLSLEPQLTIRGYLERSPSSNYATGKLWSESLAAAGVPQG